MTSIAAKSLARTDNMLSKAEYRELRAKWSESARASAHGSRLYHHCRSCGRCETAGGFCSWCLLGDYLLEAHVHVKRGQGQVCPLAGASVAAPSVSVGLYQHSSVRGAK